MSYLAKTPDGLLPCPHCGGEAEARDGSSTTPYIRCKSCGCRTGSSWDMNKLKAAWNRRAERTCRDTDYDTGSITCSECGEITRNTLFWAEVDGGWTVKGHRPRFCSNCGARVVDES